MKWFKYIVDGYGNAASIALPTYGIISTTLGLLAGGAFTVILGSASLGLLGFLSLPFAYWSYRQYMLSNKVFQEAKQKAIEDSVEQIINFYLVQLRQYILNNNISFLSEINKTQYVDFIKRDIATLKKNLRGLYSEYFLNLLDSLIEDTSSESFLNQFLSSIHSIKNNSVNEDGYFLKNGNDLAFCAFKTNLKSFFEKKNTLIKFEALPYSTYFKEGLTGFSTGFGTAAGGGAGFCSVMVGLGFFAGIAAVPIVGWSLLAAGLLSGCIIAGIYMYVAHEKKKQQQFIEYYQGINKDLNLANSVKEDGIKHLIHFKHKKKRTLASEDRYQQTRNIEDRSNVVPFQSQSWSPTLFSVGPSTSPPPYGAGEDRGISPTFSRHKRDS